MQHRLLPASVLLSAIWVTLALTAADPEPGFPPGGPGFGGPPPGFGPGGPGPMQEERRLVKQFDADGDKHLNAAERRAAREFIAREAAEGRGPRRPGGPRRGGGPDGPGPAEDQTPPAAGPKLTPADVRTFPDAPLYDPLTLRTLFLQFENEDWEKELSDFNNTDVEVPALLTVDGKTYRDVGVHFRGASSYFTVGEGRKRSLNLSLDDVHKDQRLDGVRTLNLLNSHTDPTFLRSVLYPHVARQYIPAPRANYVRVVINGESWGVYVNLEQFNSDFTQAAFGTSGPRWKVPGSPRGNGGLAYLGEDVAAYRKLYEIKSKDDPKSWAQLIRLTRVLNETPLDQLEQELEPMLDIDGALKFLALENVFINSDGYWTRASDYNLAVDAKGRFRIVPHDVNETFGAPGGPGMGGGPGGPGGRGGGGGRRVDGVKLDPFAGAGDANKPLLSRLLAVPELRERYLAHVRQIAAEWLDWNKLGPLAAQYQALIAYDVKTDTHRLYSPDAFARGVSEDVEEQGPRGPRRRLSLKSFVEQRRDYLLNYQDTKKDDLRAETK